MTINPAEKMKISRFHFTTIDSTNTWAKIHAQEFVKDHLTVVTAESQTAGRGRFNHRWFSPPKENVYASFCFFLDNYIPLIANAPQVLALSAIIVLKQFGFDVQLKWPNDLILSKKKLGGVLAETVQVDNGICIIIGIGINILMEKEELKKINIPATSLNAEKNLICNEFNLTPEMIAALLIEQFNKDLQTLKTQGFHAFIETYRNSLCHKKNDLIQFHLFNEITQGRFESIHEDGSLNLVLNSGISQNYRAGEILFE